MTRITMRNVLTGGAIVVVVIFVMYNSGLSPTRTLVSTTRHHDSSTAKSPKILLYWTVIYSSKVFMFGSGQKAFVDNGCKVTNCWATSNRSYDQSASAILFSLDDLVRIEERPKNRSAQQYYVFVEKESPALHDYSLPRFNGYFNLTLTYTMDSDFPVLSGKTLKKEQAENSKDYRDVVAGKTKLVAWMVSNCHMVSSGRMDYVKQLQKYIPVDIYGSCGPLSCPGTRDSGECYDMIERDYKFYLSFENSYCLDYMTEKVFNLLNRVVVPVVYGGGNYSRDLPPNSVINIEDYESPKALAEYLKYLDGHDEVYMQYFTWKSAYEVNSDGLKLYRQGICDLCEFLNLDNPPRKVYTNIDQWWSRDRHCDPHGMPDKLKQGMLKS